MEAEDRESWPAWGRLIDDARERMRPSPSQNAAARAVGISGTQWRSVVKGNAGEMVTRRGLRTVAAMADYVGLSPEAFEKAGRADIAKALQLYRDPESVDDFDERIERIRRDPARRAHLLRLLRSGLIPEAEPKSEIASDDRRSEAG